MKKFLMNSGLQVSPPVAFANSNAASTLWIATTTPGTGTGATTTATGFAIGVTSIVLGAAGTGTILIGDVITFAGDPNKYTVTTGIADVSTGGTIVIAAPGLVQNIAASAVAVSVSSNESPSEQQDDLDVSDYNGLNWTQIKAVGSHGEVGSSTNILTYDTWDTTVIQKAKGMTDAGSPEIELARLIKDKGQIALRAAAKTNHNFAFKIERNDKPTAGGNPTKIYNRGLVTGPRRPMGRNEDFDLEIFTLALQQVEVIVDAT